MNQFLCTQMLSLFLCKYSFGAISAHRMEGSANNMTKLSFIWNEIRSAYFIMPVAVYSCWVDTFTDCSVMTNIRSHSPISLDIFSCVYF